MERDRQTIKERRESLERREKRDKGRAELERESCAPWPPIFIHHWRTYGNWLSESKCMVGWLPVKEAIMCFSSHSLAQSLLCAERGRVHTVILPSSIIHAFLLSVFSPKPVCLDGCTNSYQRCTPNVTSQKKTSTDVQLGFHWPQCEDMLSSFQLMSWKCMKKNTYCTVKKYCCTVSRKGMFIGSHDDL